jgi:hypothetical protein
VPLSDEHAKDRSQDRLGDDTTTSMTAPTLADDQVVAFRRDGFVVARRAFDAVEIEKIARWAEELVAMPEAPGRHWVYWEESRKRPGEKIISRIENIAPFHPGFAALAGALKPAVAQLLGEEAVLFKEKINFKYPGADGFKPHQDSQAGWDRYADFFVSALVSIDKATPANGCLQIVSGQHRVGLFRSWEPLNEDDMAGMEFVDCPTEPGDVIFFDSYAPHASEPNLSDAIRRIYFATYNRKSAGDHLAQYYADKRKSYPPDIEREAGREYVFRV